MANCTNRKSNNDSDNNIPFMSPSEFYRLRRPEKFSDSDYIANIVLPREVLKYEIEKITANQKEALFETLCRKLAEKLICPNLIPQVGPTGGGDGKTDSETYPVSILITERWFIPQDGWGNDEKWAFAFSAKGKWKSKVELDIEKIVNTGRGYTKLFFISNQTISSKKKKDEQDALIKKYGIDVIILDAIWIIENIYEKDLIELTAETLNMSEIYKTRTKHLGKNDTARLTELTEIEKRIVDTQYYSHGDSQLIHDMIHSAVLSRMLELPRDEIEAKFKRAERMCKEYKAQGLLTKIVYQKAWTYINYYDDYSEFINEAIKLKELVHAKSTAIEIEWIFNIFNIYRSIHHSKLDTIPDRDIIYGNFEAYIIDVLSLRSQNQEMPCSALIANTYLTFIDLIYSLHSHENPSISLENLSKIILESKKYIEYPFEPTYQILTEMGQILSDNAEYDILIENLANASSSRESEISAGIVYFNRGVQKFKANRFKESIVYFGKTIFKLAKEETSNYFILALIALSDSYKELALPWASYNCLITAASLESKKVFEERKNSKRFLSIIKSILSTEILLGRLPNIFLWNKLFLILYQQIGDKTDDIPDDIQFDGCLAVRLLHIDQKENNLIYLPNILKNLGLQISNDAVLYLLGYENEIIHNSEYMGIKSIQELESFFQKAYSQPLIDQVYFQTEFQNSDILVLKSIIIGCSITFEFNKEKNMLLFVETILSLIESILATSVGKLFPMIESILISVIEDSNIEYFLLTNDTTTKKNTLKVNLKNILTGNYDLMRESFWEFISFLLANCFHSDDIQGYLDNIFRNESVNERISFGFDHKKAAMNVMGNNPEIFFDDWRDDRFIHKNKRTTPVVFEQNTDKVVQGLNFDKEKFEDTPHNKFIVHSIIDDGLWNNAGWKAVGILASPNFLGLALGFDNFDVGKRIFEDWKKLIGKIDREELIDITLIKGINKYHPYWYKIVVTTNQDKVIIDKDKYHMLKSRIHKMEAENSSNLDMFEGAFKILKRFTFFPSSTKSLLPEHLQYGIIKSSITIKYAWQIGLDDQNQVAIDAADEPILPEGISDIPILALLKQRKKKI